MPLNVLIIDDNRGDAMLERYALEQQGFACRIISVESGQEALACLRHEGDFFQAPPVDMVLLDGSLPDMTGIEILRVIREEECLSGLAVVVVTGSSDLRVQAEFLACGADMVLEKENNYDALVRKFSVLEKFV